MEKWSGSIDRGAGSAIEWLMREEEIDGHTAVAFTCSFKAPLGDHKKKKKDRSE